MLTAAFADVFLSIPCFASLGPRGMERLLEAVSERSYSKGEVLMLEGEPCPGLFVVKSGSVRLYRSSHQGQEQIVRVVGRGGCVECVPFFDGGANPVSAGTLEPTTTWFLPAAQFEWMLTNCPEVLAAFAPILARRLRSLVGTVGDFSHRQVYPRLAKLLCQLSEQRDGKMLVSPDSPLHQENLACMLGCSRQVVNASLRRLVKDGVISIDRRQIVVLDFDALRLAV
jgi:CRP/FNR family transcriptional regulator